MPPPVLALLFLLGPLLTANRQNAVLDGDIHLARLDARQLDVERELLATLANVQRRRPVRAAAPAGGRVIEEPIDLPPPAKQR